MKQHLKTTKQGINAKVDGDFILEQQPTTYEECVAVYRSLSKHLGAAPDYKGAVAKTMVLTPIKHLCNKATAILNRINDQYMLLVTRMLDDIERNKVLF